jgi:small GTP-binding protein
MHDFDATMMLEGRVVRCVYLDTAGQEDYDRLRPLSYPGTDCFMMCYSVSSEASLRELDEKFFPEVKHHCPEAATAVIGLKSDLRTDEETRRKLDQKGLDFVSPAAAQEVARRNGAVYWGEFSALTQQDQAPIFADIGRICVLRSGAGGLSNLNRDKTKLGCPLQ